MVEAVQVKELSDMARRSPGGFCSTGVKSSVSAAAADKLKEDGSEKKVHKVLYCQHPTMPPLIWNHDRKNMT